MSETQRDYTWINCKISNNLYIKCRNSRLLYCKTVIINKGTRMKDNQRKIVTTFKPVV